jgi:hypothetical protein
VKPFFNNLLILRVSPAAAGHHPVIQPRSRAAREESPVS